MQLSPQIECRMFTAQGQNFHTRPFVNKRTDWPDHITQLMPGYHLCPKKVWVSHCYCCILGHPTCAFGIVALWGCTGYLSCHNREQRGRGKQELIRFERNWFRHHGSNSFVAAVISVVAAVSSSSVASGSVGAL